MNKRITHFLLTTFIGVVTNFNFAYALPESNKTQIVLEVVMFTANRHVSSNKVRKLALSITPVLKKYPGFISREFAENVHMWGQYIDIVKWKSLADASYAAKSIITNKKMKQFIAIMQDYKMYHFKLTTNLI